MIGRFNVETLDLVSSVSVEVAAKLSVDIAWLCVCTGSNADYDADDPTAFSICFETPEDNTWAVLEYARDPDEDLRTLLNNFMTDPDVEWMKQGVELKSADEPTLTIDYEQAVALHKVLSGDAHMVDTSVLNDVSLDLEEFVNENSDESLG